MINLLGLIATAPLVLLADWFAFIKGLPPLQQEITKASHGVFMILAAVALSYGHLQLGYTYLVPWEDRQYILPGLGFVGLWGLFWAIVGATRSRHFRDYHLLGRAVMKVILAGAIWYMARDWPRYYNWQLWCWEAAMVVVAFCVITGLTKAILLLRPLPQLNVHGVNSMPYGPADFSDGNGLQ